MILKTLNIQTRDRIIGLDVMRSLAILSVVFGHYINFFYNYLDPVIPLTNLSLKRFVYYVVMGFDGVDLFFVLSGFLIGHSILKAFSLGRLNYNYLLHNFWIKRWFRTLPNYLVVLCILIILSFFIPQTGFETSISVSYYRYFIFAQNFFNGELVFFPESWSLSIEEWFYISFPILLTGVAVFSSKMKNKQYLLLASILFFIIVGSLLRGFYSGRADFNTTGNLLWNGEIRTAVFMRLDAIIYGVLMAYFKIYHFDMFNRYKYLFLVTGICVLAYAFNRSFLNTSATEALKFSHGYYFTFVGAGMAMLLPFFYNLKIKALFLVELFTFISVISYSVYLVNYTLVQHSINYLLNNPSLGSSMLKCILSLILTIIISMLLYKFIETPFMNLRKKLIRE